jgi:hypothetical protein
MMTASLYNCGHCGRPQIVGSPCLCWRQGNEMISIEKLGVAVSDFIGQHGLVWSDALVEAWQEAEADYTDEMTRAMAQPAVPDAIGPNEDELPAYAAGWNDCRAEMLKAREA